MSKIPKKKKAARRAYWYGRTRLSRICSNCGEPGPHFVPPSLGESGFYACKKKEK